MRAELSPTRLERSAFTPHKRSGPGLLVAVVLVLALAVFVALIGTRASGDSAATATEAAPGCSSRQPNTSDRQSLLLVNPQNPIPDEYEVSLRRTQNGHLVDKQCYPDLQAMLEDCEAEGLHPLICSSYRSQEKQQQLFDNKVSKLVAQGYGAKKAREEAATVVAIPGTSEHQTGLAVDLVDANHQLLDESQSNTPTQKWLMANSWRYGFILRYPPEKSGVTGIIYEPWHYRYVGKEAAKEMFERNVCLEEYL